VFEHQLSARMGGTCRSEAYNIDDMNSHYGTYICDEGCTITATGSARIKVYYGHHSCMVDYHSCTGGYMYRYVEKTYSLPATIPCTNSHFDCDPNKGSTKQCRYEWVYSSAKSVAGQEAVDYGEGLFADSDSVNMFSDDHGDVAVVDYGGGLFVDGVPFVPISYEPALTAEPLSGGVSVGPLTITDMASIVVVIVSLINLCCVLRMCARRCFRKSGAVEYRKVQFIASDVEDKEEQQML
jgi:hypothetical protein